MSRLPKPPFASGIPSSGLPTPGKRRALSNPQQRSSPFSDLTPEQEALLQEAMEKYNPEVATVTKEVRNTSSPSNS
ncbi:10164_t:CDS:1, partial [Paraglomus occultum]